MPAATPGFPVSWVYAALLYTATIWGVNLVALKVLTGYFDVVMLGAIRMALAFVCIAVICRGLRLPIPRLTRAQFGWVFGASALMIYLHQIALGLGLMWSSATHGVLILGLNPLLSVLLAALLFGERLNLTRLLGVGLGIAGAMIVILNRSGAQLHSAGAGDLVLIGAMLVYVGAGVCLRRLVGSVHPLVIGYYMHLIGAVMLGVHAAAATAWRVPMPLFPGWWPWLLILFSAVCSTALGNLSWNYGISRIGLGRTTIFANWVPISGLVSAVLFLDETVRPIHLLGFACVLAGTWLALRRVRP